MNVLSPCQISCRSERKKIFRKNRLGCTPRWKMWKFRKFQIWSNHISFESPRREEFRIGVGIEIGPLPVVLGPPKGIKSRGVTSVAASQPSGLWSKRPCCFLKVAQKWMGYPPVKSKWNRLKLKNRLLRPRAMQASETAIALRVKEGDFQNCHITLTIDS